MAASKTSATPREQSQQASQEARRSLSPPSAAAVTPPPRANRASHISDLKSPDGATPLALPEEARQAIQREREEGEHGPERYDEPGAAAEFYRLKRAPEGETTVPVERYLTAREQMRAMRDYSTAQESFLPSRQALQTQAAASALGAWRALGPGNIGGRTRALLIHPTNPKVMYAAGVAGGVWKTTNGGASWVPLADLLANIAVNLLAIDPTNPNVIYADTGEGYFNSDAARGLGIFKTADGGANWTHLANTNALDFYYVNDIVISPHNSQRIYAATRTGVWRSLDSGATWAVENTGFANVVVESLALNTVGGVTSLYAFTHGRGAWRVTVNHSGCNYALSATSQAFGAAGGAATLAQLSVPTGVALDGAGNLYIADGGNHRVVVVAMYSPTATANAASFSLSAVASEAIVSVFGASMTTTAEGATTLPLPTMLAGTTIKVRDSRGVERLAPLFYVSPGQINYLIPAGTADGFATLTITSANGQISTGAVEMAAVTPGLFTANTDGQGAPAAIIVHAKPDGAQTFDLAAVFDPAQGKNIPRQMDLGPEGDVVVIELFGTGFRYRSSLDNVTATIGGVPVQVYYAGAQGNFAGLDQVNVEVPRSLIGRGEVDLVLTVDGKAANTIKIKIK